MDIRQAIPIVIICGMIAFGGWMAIKNWTTGGSADDYEIICLPGGDGSKHQYHRANWSNKALLGIVLHDDGTPVKCK